nr:reverse transcriptase domain-containing protein [Tanacetum cinerariifolium]
MIHLTWSLIVDINMYIYLSSASQVEDDDEEEEEKEKKDFLNETPSNDLQSTSVVEAQEEPWTLFTDGSSCVDGPGAGLILTNPDGIEFTYALRFQFAASNNEAEYEALIVGLRIATQMG